MADYNALGDAISSASGQGATQSGDLGYEIDGVFRVVDPDNPKRFLVRFPNGNWVSALHRNKVVQKPNLPVIVGYDNLGNPYIVDIDPTRTNSFLSSTSTGAAVGLHDHVRNSALQYIIDTWLLKQLRMYVSSGTTIAITPGSYRYQGVLLWYEGGTLDLSSYFPTDTGYQRWLVVGIDPATEDIVVEGGSQSYGDYPLDPDDIELIPFVELGYMPIAAIWVNEGQTTLQNYQIEDLRFPVGGNTSDAGGIAYVPDDDTLWTDPDPTSVQEALDAIALITGAATDDPTPDTLALRDGDANFATNVLAEGTTQTAVTGTPIALTVASTPTQRFTGTVDTVVTLPDPSTLRNGHWFHFYNNMTAPGKITVNYFTGSPLMTLMASQEAHIVLFDNTLTSGNWSRSGSERTEILTNKRPEWDITAVTSAAGTTVLTMATTPIQRITGSTTQTVQLPDCTTLNFGHWIRVINDSTGLVTVTGATGTVIVTLLAGQWVDLFNRSISTAAGAWSVSGSSTTEVLTSKQLAFAVTSTTSAAGTLTLVLASDPVQRISGSTTHTVKLPDATTLPIGWRVFVYNESTGVVTVVDNGSNTLATLSNNQWVELTARAVGTSNGSWILRGSSITETLSKKIWSSLISSTTSSGGTLTLALANDPIQRITGTSTHTVKMPDATTLPVGWSVRIINESTGSVAVQDNSAGALYTLLQNQWVEMTVRLTSTAAGSWLARGSSTTEKHSNKTINDLRWGFLSTASSGGTLTLTAASAYWNRITGTSTHTVVLPDATTLQNGHQFYILNSSTGLVTINRSAGGGAGTLLTGQWARLTLLDNSSVNGIWDGEGSADGETLSNKIISPDQVLGALVEDTAPAEGDYVPTYDVSALDYKKVLLAKIRAAVISNNDVSATPTAVEFALAFPNAVAGAHYVLNDNTVGTTYWVTYKGSAQWSYVAMSNATYVALASYLSGLADNRLLYLLDETSGIDMYAVNPAISEGRDLVLNGDFATNTIWTGANWTISGGVVTHAAGATTNLSQASLMVLGKIYKVVYTVSGRTAGSVQTVAGVANSTNATFTEYFIATATALNFTPTTDFDGSIDNVSLKQVVIRASTDYPSSTGRLNVVVNSDMDVAAAFSGTNWAWSSGGYVHTPGSTTNLSNTASTVVIGKTYDYEIVISGRTAGQVTVKIGTTGAGSAITTNGTTTDTSGITAAGTAGVYITPDTNFDGKIESIKVTPHDSLLVFNGDGSTTTGWTAENAATLSSVSGWLRVAYGGTASPTAAQTNMVIGWRYHLTLDCRGDGASAAPIIRDGTTTIFTGTTSNSTQPVDIIFVATTAILRLRSSATAAGYSEFDNVILKAINPLDATNTGATVNQDSLGLPLLGYLFDATNDYGLLPFADLNSVMAVTSAHWKIIGRIRDVSVLSDATLRYLLRLRVDASNEISIRKTTSTNSYAASYTAGGTTTTVTFTSTLTTDFVFDVVIDTPNNVLIVYVNGVEAGRTSTLGTWSGNLVTTNTNLGAGSQTPTAVWDGYIWLVQHRNTVPTAAQIAAEAQLAGVI